MPELLSHRQEGEAPLMPSEEMSDDGLILWYNREEIVKKSSLKQEEEVSS